MRREDVRELHSIQPIENVPSILRLGILSHDRARNLRHRDISMATIQDARQEVAVDGGRPLHEYANLYFHARNPMMSARRHEHASICVLRIDPAALDLADVVVSDSNAASRYVRFGAAAEGLDFINEAYVFAEDWRDSDQITEWRKKAARCAEVLVPDLVPVAYIRGAYACSHGSAALRAAGPTLDIAVDDRLFFC